MIKAPTLPSSEKNSMLYWFPKIKDLGIPYPKSEIVPFPVGNDYWKFLDESLPQKLYQDSVKACRKIGYPVFMRTDQLSGKHDWNDTCYVEAESVLEFHIHQLFENSAMAGILGRPINALVFREFVALESKFKAFHGMPVARERRYFINDGIVVCHHPYWIEDAIRFRTGTRKPKKWKQQLKELNMETEDEIKILTKYAFKIAYALQEEGYWSVDFAKTKHNGWILIDMAVGYDSWHPPCEHKLEKA